MTNREICLSFLAGLAFAVAVAWATDADATSCWRYGTKLDDYINNQDNRPGSSNRNCPRYGQDQQDLFDGFSAGTTDWSQYALFYYDGTGAADSTRTNRGSFGSGGDLTNVFSAGTGVGQRTSPAPPFTGRTVAYDFIEQDGERLTCTDANCGGVTGWDICSSNGGNCTWGVVATKEKNASAGVLTKGARDEVTDQPGIGLFFNTVSDRLECASTTSGNVRNIDQTPNNSWTPTSDNNGASSSQYYGATCVLTANSLEAHLRGVPTGSPDATAAPGDSSEDFFISQDNVAADWDGAVAEAYLFDFAMTDAEVCRLHSCGVIMEDGPCVCNGASFSNTGYNNQTCDAGGTDTCTVSGIVCTTNSDCITGNGCTLPSDCSAAPTNAP